MNAVLVLAGFFGFLVIGVVVEALLVWGAARTSMTWRRPYKSYYHGYYELHLDEFKDGSWLVSDTEGLNRRFHSFNQALAFFTETLNVARHRTHFNLAA